MCSRFLTVSSLKHSSHCQQVRNLHFCLIRRLKHETGTSTCQSWNHVDLSSGRYGPLQAKQRMFCMIQAQKCTPQGNTKELTLQTNVRWHSRRHETPSKNPKSQRTSGSESNRKAKEKRYRFDVSVNRKIVRSNDIDALAQVVRRIPCDSFSDVNIATAINRLASLSRRSRRLLQSSGALGTSARSAHHKEVPPTLQLMLPLATRCLPSMKAQAVANVVHGFGVLSKELLRMASENVDTPASTIPSDSVSEHVGVHRIVMETMQVIESSTGDAVSFMSAQELANFCWGYAKLRREFVNRKTCTDSINDNSALELLNCVSLRAERIIHEMDQQNLANIMWALAVLDHMPSRGVWALLEHRLVDIIATLTPQSLSNVLWAYGTLGVRPGTAVLPVILNTASTMAGRNGSMTSQSVSNVAWALGTLGYTVSGNESLRKLFRELTERVVSIHTTFNAQEVANVLWGMAVVGVRPPARLLQLLEETYVAATQDAVPAAIVSAITSIASAKRGVSATTPPVTTTVALPPSHTDVTGVPITTNVSAKRTTFDALSTLLSTVTLTSGTSPTRTNVRTPSCTPVHESGDASAAQTTTLTQASTGRTFTSGRNHRRQLEARTNARPAEVVAILWSFAVFGINLHERRPRLFAHLANKIFGLSDAMTTQELSTVLWSLSVFNNLAASPVAQHALEKIFERQVVASESASRTFTPLVASQAFDKLSQMQLHQVFMSIDQLEIASTRPHNAALPLDVSKNAALNDESVIAEALQRILFQHRDDVDHCARAFAQDSLDERNPSAMQAEVFSVLQTVVGADNIASEVQLGRECGYYTADAFIAAAETAASQETGGGPDNAVVRVGALPVDVVVEVDGPSHFTYAIDAPMGGRPQQTGATILKHRIITNAGTGVVSVPFYEWNAIDASTPHARAKFLANKIKSVARFMQQAKRN